MESKKRAQFVTSAFDTTVGKDKIKPVLMKIPKDPEAWMLFQINMVRKKMGPLKRLTDRDIRQIILATKKANSQRSKVTSSLNCDQDPDLPSCFEWSIEDVGQWLQTIGFSNLKDMFANNFITGKKLISVDASALSRMGLRDFNQIKKLTAEIRNILKIHRPNFMRAMLRKVPFEQYLRQRQYTGRKYNTNFEKFCKENGYPYEKLKKNPLGLIACTTQLEIYFSSLAVEIGEDDVSENNSLMVAPSVEFTVRHRLVRDKVMTKLFDELLEDTWKHPSRLQEILEAGFTELGLRPDELMERIKFGRLIADEMLKEALRTEAILQDIDKFQKFVKDGNVSEDTLKSMREIATDFFNSCASIGTLLCMGDLQLEKIFRQEPDFNEFVDGIIGEAENFSNDITKFIDEIIEQAMRKVYKNFDDPLIQFVNEVFDQAKKEALEFKRTNLDEDPSCETMLEFVQNIIKNSKKKVLKINLPHLDSTAGDSMRTGALEVLDSIEKEL